MRKILFLFMLAICANISSFAQDDSKMYTAFIVNVARNISWNELSQDEDFVISVMGNEQLANDLSKKLSDKFIGLHKIVIKNVNNPSQLSASSMVVMNKNAYKFMQTVANTYQSKQCVILACSKGQCPNGADMSLFNQGDRVAFQMSNSRLKRHGLVVSAKLRDLGEMVD